MRKNPIESTNDVENFDGSSGAPDGYLLPKNTVFPGTSDSDLALENGLLLPRRKSHPLRAFLDGNFARRTLPLRASEYSIWDTALPGFGLRVRPAGRYYWFVRVRHRNTQRRVTLGRADEVDADFARAQARRLLAEVALDGLPKRTKVGATPPLNDYVETYWSDIARYWKPSTEKRNHEAWRRDLAPVFGTLCVADVSAADITRWRDDCAGSSETNFNRAIPVLAALFKYAEALHLRRKGSNPCRGMPRYKRQPCERYLSPLEYRRIGAALREAEANHPSKVAVVRLLLYTGARVSEVRDLCWEWVRPPHLVLPDSKTGPKIIWLNSQALAILEAQPRGESCHYVFPNAGGTAPLRLDNWWPTFRRMCAFPDLRIHDLRHSFASAAIMDNVPLATIGKLLGHVLPETTAKYAHLADEVIADAAVRISGNLAQAIGLRT